jgi:beta-glucosidase
LVGSVIAQDTARAANSPATRISPAENAAWTRKADALIARMTVEEKIGQLVLSSSPGSPAPAPGLPSPLEEEIRQAACGNVYNAQTVAYVHKLQAIAVRETRLKIPLLFGFDTIHGYKTIFPIPLGGAASWDLPAIERADRVAAIEATAAGLNWTFAPMVDIARDPRWGRIAEGAGEDPFLGSAIARAAVRGFQGTNLAAPDSLLACVKHFAAYGAAQAGRDYNTVDLSERTLREVYLPPFRAAIDEGALSVMSAFDDLNGVPATANRFLLRQVLREEWGFKGFVVSDSTAINELVKHGIAANLYQAGRAALAAGVDMDMRGAVYHDHLREMLRHGDITKRQLDDAVRDVLRAKFALGLFDDPFRNLDTTREAVLDNYPAEHLEAAYQLACESLVLLKNENGVLPLKPGARIAVIGPLAETRRDLLGSWDGLGEPERVTSVLAAIESNNASGTVAQAQGCEVASTNRLGFAAALEAAREADVVVMVGGESWDMSGEAASRTSLNLPGVQTELLRALKETGKPLVLVLLNGRPLALEQEASLADALLEAWYPGTEGGRAIADVLFGRRNPSGRLTVTFPRNLGQVPIYYNAMNTGRPIDPAMPDEKYQSKYLDAPNTPLFPFGFGLSYTTFSVSAPELDRQTLRPGEKLTVSVDVANTGKMDGAEVVQLYLRQPVASVTRPVLELKGFQRVELKAGEHRRVTFAVGGEQMRFLRFDLTWGTEPGQFQVFVGPNSRDLQSAGFELLGK